MRGSGRLEINFSNVKFLHFLVVYVSPLLLFVKEVPIRFRTPILNNHLGWTIGKFIYFLKSQRMALFDVGEGAGTVRGCGTKGVGVLGY